MVKEFLTRPFRWFVICEYPFGFVLPITAIQYDLGGKPTVLIVVNDNLREDVFEAAKGGRAFLRPVPVTVVGEFEPGLALVRSAQLNPAQRVVLAQRALGRRVDDHLGWLNLDGVFFSVRALSPYKSSYPLEKLDDDERFAQLAIQWGAVLATAHARADGDFGGGLLRHNFDRSLFELIDGNHKKFRTLVREIAFEYLERVIGDFENFVAHRGSSCQ